MIHSASFWYPPILTYHRLDPEPADDTPTLTPTAFGAQMEYAASGWRVIPLADLVDWLQGKGPLPQGAVCLTFDDGTEDTYRYAFPVLQRLGLPATVFMITDNIGKPGSLNLHQMQEMHRGRITFGSHTDRHAYLPGLSLEACRKELQISKEKLESLLGQPVDLLSYPGGGYTAPVMELAAHLGYRAACTTNRGCQRRPIDPLALRRITAHSWGPSFLGVGIRVSGFYDLSRRLRPPH